ncbi:hypothetical protein [Alteromonas mediterranea]|uniref:hypothetical protein n=1 Tax=Alteromonas mediterranea TaxID=314275 RepID=UPI0012FB3CDF|nr:hypothetical protein [Alteromonas mediterranea]QGX63703.1 hypothetical protein FJN15_18815 [Alteromonas mediterranea]
MRKLAVLLSSILTVSVSGCSSTSKPNYDYLKMDEIATLKSKVPDQTDMFGSAKTYRTECQRIYKKDGLVAITFGDRTLGVYDPNTGLMWTSVPIQGTKTNTESDSCGKLNIIKTDAQRTAYARNFNLSNQNRESSKTKRLLKLRDALDSVANYTGTDISSDLKGEISLIFKKYNRADTYMSWSGSGDIVDRTRANVQQLLTHAQSYTADKIDIVADLTKRTSQYNALEKAKRKLVDGLNREHREIWNNRLEENNSLQIGDQVCAYDNKYGNVEQIGASNIKVKWSGYFDEKSGFVFGNFSRYDAISATEIDYKTKNLDATEWLPTRDIARCPFNP